MDAIARIAWPQKRSRSIGLASIGDAAGFLFSLLLALAAMFLLVRRLAGGLNTPLPASMLFGVGLIAAAAAWTVHLLIVAGRSHETALRATIAKWLSVASLPIIAAAVSLPASSGVGLVVLWLTVGGAELGLWRMRKIGQPGLPVFLRRPQPSSVATEIAPMANGAPASSLFDITDKAATQKLVYRHNEANKLIVEGWLRADFVAEQRTAVVHIAFCPAFDETPVVEAELADGPLCEIRPTLVLPWGVRWEVKLESPATEPTTAAIEFVAQEPH
jgi:hypothetical protein